MERLERQIEEAESELLQLNSIIEQESSLELLQSYYEQQKLIEEKRDGVYKELEKFL